MNTIATARIEGPEAIGDAKIVLLQDGTYQLQLTNFWVSPGAPDVRIVFSKNENGDIDNETIRFISELPAGNFEKNFTIDHLNDFKEMKTLIVYCKQYFAHFGHGTITVK